MSDLPFKRRHFILLGVSIIVLILGYIVMSIDKEAFGFGFLGLTLGPILVLIGFILVFFAVLKK